MAALPIAATAAAIGGSLYLNAKHHLWSDITAGSLSNLPARANTYLTAQAAKQQMLTYLVFAEQATINRPNQTWLVFEGKEWTYRQFYEATNRVGHWLIEELGVKRGEIVGLDGGNSPEHLMLWFALDGIGAVPSFVNCNLTGDSLLHCVKICDCKYLLTDRDISRNVEPVRGDLEQAGIEIVYYDPPTLAAHPNPSHLPSDRQKDVDPSSTRCLLYTSGTTGNPKAIIMIAGREMMTGHNMSLYLRLKPTDRFYTCMPLYHGAAHGLCITPAVHGGCTVVLGRKFSHRSFWPEVRSSKANIIQYVGELCRYLLNAPPSPLDKQHNVYMAWGNGMRPDVWQKFQERFGIQVINELYAATDGLGAMFNANQGEFTRNAIGKRGFLWRCMRGSDEVLVKTDVDTEEIARGKDGFAIKCGIDEPGEVLHQLDPAAPSASFAGYYKNQGATDKRYIKDVFRKGDLWFRSGDMMRWDRDGRVYFVDRLGDTFRWKSENVSTNEVSDVLGKFDQIAEANVYGVSVPNADGRCGCAAVVVRDGVTEDTFDFMGLAKHAAAALPRYAVPYFVRISRGLDYTGTHKLQKGRLKREGIDPDVVAGTGDVMYWWPEGEARYIPFTREAHQSLKGGQLRL